MKTYQKTLISLTLTLTLGLTGLTIGFANSQTSAQTPNKTTPTAASIAKGKKLATKLCSHCHNIETTGKSTAYRAPPFRTFASKWPLEDLEEALAEGIVVGHSIMPEFELETDDITALLDFMGDLAKKAGLVKK